MRLKEEDTKIMWEKRCGFVDISIGELYAHLCDSLSRYHWPYEKVMVDIEMSVGDKIFDTGRVLVLGELECPGSVCSLLGGTRQNRLSNKNVSVGDVEFSVCDIGKGLHIYPDNTFDCIFSVHGLGEFEVTIAKLFKVIKPSGRLILVEPQPYSGIEIHDLSKSKCYKGLGSHNLNKGMVRLKLEQAGFRIDEIEADSSEDSELIASVVKPKYCFETDGFRFISAETEEDLEKVFKLRYKVYCVELGIESKNDSGLQRDVYDEYATHFLALDSKNQPVGTLRAVTNNPIGFPMEADFRLNEYMRANGISRATEAGRFAIDKSLSTEVRAIVGFGLMKGLIEYCRETEINDIFNITQLKVLKRFEVTGFSPIGEPFEYPGRWSGVLWVPMHCNIQHVYNNYSGNVRGYSDLP